MRRGGRAEYRGAYHWGVPKQSENEEEFGFEVNDVRQSHDIELQIGVNDWLLLSVVGVFEQPLGEDLKATAIEAGVQLELVARKGNGIGLAVQAEYESALNHGVQEDGEPNEFAMGPIVELATGPLLLTLNPLFGKQIGTFADQEGLGFEYGWRGEYDVNKRWALAVEMFGEIEDLANAYSFNEQIHSIGPTLLINFGGEEEEAEGGNGEERAKAVGDDDEAYQPAPMAFSMNVGVQFGLTDATSDTALKFQGSLAF